MVTTATTSNWESRGDRLDSAQPADLALPLFKVDVSSFTPQQIVENAIVALTSSGQTIHPFSQLAHLLSQPICALGNAIDSSSQSAHLLRQHAHLLGQRDGAMGEGDKPLIHALIQSLNVCRIALRQVKGRPQGIASGNQHFFNAVKALLHIVVGLCAGHGWQLANEIWGVNQ